MALLIAATLLMVASHVVPSAPGVRARLIARLGRAGFLGGYSVLSLAALGLVVWAFRVAEPGPWLAAPGPFTRWTAVLAMPLAVFLVVGRLTTAAERPEPRGVYRLTPIPGSLGVLLWCGLHLVNLAEARLIVVFLGMTVIALVAALKHWELTPDAWRGGWWLGIGGRLDTILAEIGLARLGLTLAVYLALLWLHPRVIGVDPLTGLS